MTEEQRRQLEALGIKLPAAGTAPGSTGGIPADIFGSARERTPTSGTPTTIPIFRQRKTATINRFIDEGADNKAQREMKVAPTAEQFDQETANAQFSKILFDKDLLEKWQALVVKSGLLTPAEATDAVKLEQAWKTAVQWSINMKAATKGKTEMTPFDALEAVAQNTGASALAAQQYAADNFTGTKVQTSSTVDKRYSAQQGEALRQLLGRNPTDSELAAYKRGLAEYAEQNPTVTKQATTYQDGEQVAVSQEVSGGFDEAAAAYASAAGSSPDMAMNQQATTYYDALVRAIGAAV
jgi:hypothetical protein